MLDEKKLKVLIAKILKMKVEKITLDSGMDNLEQWDSLSHLSILSELDRLSKGKASKIRGLSNSVTVKQILKLLKSNKLSK
jgi:acyl carrier protein